MKGMITTKEMQELPKDKWPIFSALETEPLKIWVSNDYMAVLYRQRADDNLRLTVNRTRRNGKDWRDGITWDELQRIKNECLGLDIWCIENYPSEDKLVNVVNQRHLFILDEPPKTRFPEKATVSDEDVKTALDLVKAMVKASREAESA